MQFKIIDCVGKYVIVVTMTFRTTKINTRKIKVGWKFVSDLFLFVHSNSLIPFVSMSSSSMAPSPHEKRVESVVVRIRTC